MGARLLRLAVLLAVPILFSADRPTAPTTVGEAGACLQAAQTMAASTGLGLCDILCMPIWNPWYDGPERYGCDSGGSAICQAILSDLRCPGCVGGPE